MVTPPDVRGRRRPRKILRFLLTERLLHWAIAVPFLVCYLTALLIVFYYNPQPTRPHREIVSWIHRGSGISFIVLPLLVLLGSWHRLRIHWDNIKAGWIWTLDDIKWLLLMPFAALSRRVVLPEAGKFNAGEKLNFMWTMASFPLYAITGLAIWFGSSYGILPYLVHFGLAAVATFLVAGHLFMALINPSSRTALGGMFSGRVDRAWATHHHGRWYAEQHTKPGRATTQTGARPGSRADTVSQFIQIGRSVSPAVVALIVISSLGLLVAGSYVAWPDRTATHPVSYLAGGSPLWAGPAEDADRVFGGPLVRGASVTLLEDRGEFALIRDAEGREGYVFSVDLLEARPRFDDAELAPPACRWSEDEINPTGCRGRADRKLSLCQADRADAGEDPSGCLALHQDCLRACDRPVTVTPVGPASGVKDLRGDASASPLAGPALTGGEGGDDGGNRDD